jgi:hypothetical protein
MDDIGGDESKDQATYQRVPSTPFTMSKVFSFVLMMSLAK